MPLGIALLTCLPFLPVLDARFLSWDDEPNFLNNPDYRGLGWAQLRWMFTTTLLGHYIPLTWMTFGLNYVLGGMNPWGYHLGNLLLHAANAGLFYLVARRLLALALPPHPALSPGGGEGALTLGAAFAALVFGAHPLRVESVAWVTERRDVLCAFFFMLAVLAYLRGVARGRGLEKPWRALSIGAFLLALLSKAAAMPLPAALLLLDIYPLGRLRPVGWRRLVIEKVPYLVLAAATAVMAVIAQSSAEAVSGYERYGAVARVAMTAYSLVFYPWKFVWSASLSPLYELPPQVNPLAWWHLVSAFALTVVTGVLWLARRRCPGALAAWVYSALMVLPVTGAVIHAGVQLVADRYSYLSGLGFAVLAGGALTWLLRARGQLKPSVVSAGVLVAALVLVGWGAGSWRQSKIWHDSETLWRWALDLDPNCAVCSGNLGSELVFTPSPDPKRLAEAEALLRRAVALQPQRALGYHLLGVALARQRRFEEAEAAFREYMRRDPRSAFGPADLGLLRSDQHRYAEAIPLLRQALTMSPGLADARRGLVRAFRQRAKEVRREGRADEADALDREAAGILTGASGSAAGAQRSTTTAR